VAASHAHRGEWDRTIAVVDDALAIIRDRRLGYVSGPMLLSQRARAQLGQGDTAGARSSAAEAVESAAVTGTRFYEAQARHQLGRALLASGEEHGAAEELRRALSIVEALGISAYGPQIRVDLAYANRAAGDDAAAQQELTTAHRLFVEIGATGQAGRLEAELAAKRVP
jgi:ATP/maltotriose-dependent transcriptional regulator MalT